MEKREKVVVGFAKVDSKNPKPTVDALFKHAQEQIAASEARKAQERSVDKHSSLEPITIVTRRTPFADTQSLSLLDLLSSYSAIVEELRRRGVNSCCLLASLFAISYI